MAEFDFGLLLKLAPKALPAYRDALGAASAQQTLDRYGISKNELRLCHFFAQVYAECGALTLTRESLDYRISTLMRVWPKRFPTEEAAAPYAHNEEALAEKVYGGRMGNVDQGDGYKFRGRGLLQITGRQAYAHYGQQLNIDIENDPDLAFGADHCLAIAAAEWAASGHDGKTCNELADEDSLVGVTYAVNGGQTGISDRRFWLRRMKAVLKGQADQIALTSRATALITSEAVDATASSTPVILTAPVTLASSDVPVALVVPDALKTQTVVAVSPDDAGSGATIQRLIKIASAPYTLQKAQDVAAQNLLDYDGEIFPRDGCAITLSVLLQEAGFKVPDTYQALALGNLLKEDGWHVIGIGDQKDGDIGSTCYDVAHHGFDHIYLVLHVSNPDEMIIADNQQPKPHFRFASGQGKTPTRFFLRAPGAAAPTVS